MVLLSKYQNFTMSLSAIAGLVVAIGITADSFIVYFERLRDEVRDGKTLRPAVEAGWKRARRTILVSDTVSFLAAVLLYHFAVSDVQGFAYTLGLTTLIDVIVVFLFTKPMVTLLAGTKFFSSGNKWSGLDPERLGAKTPWRSATRRTVRTQRHDRTGRPAPAATPRPPRRRHDGGLGGIAGRLYRGEVSINFVGRQRMWYTISGAHPAGQRDRAAGARAELLASSSRAARSSSSRRTTLDQPGRDLPGRERSGRRRRRPSSIASSPLHTQWTVQTGVADHDRDRRTSPNALEQTFHITQSNMTLQFVGPTWGSQITTKAVEALIIFLVVIVIYLSIAFEWRMAVAAFVALMHDIVITIGVYALTGFQVSPTTVIGLLTILGYSLYDTVVVFDKVRENTAGLLTTQRSHLQRRGQPGAQPDPGPIDQHLADRAHPGRVDPVHRRRACSARAR